MPWLPTDTTANLSADGIAFLNTVELAAGFFDHETGKPYDAGIHFLDVDCDVVAWNEEASTLSQPIIDAGRPGGSRVPTRGLSRFR